MNDLLLRRIQQQGGSPTPPTPPEGAIPFPFSVSATKRVYFSNGNLQYHCVNNIFRFAENQYDVIGSANTNISPTYDGWIDLFGWGTSGYHNPNDTYNIYYHPYDSNSTQVGTQDDNYYGYGPSKQFALDIENRGLIGQNANYDWGVYNKILNPKTNTFGNVGDWRLFTYDEFNYLINTRNTTSDMRCAKAVVNNKYGLIIFPDTWDSSIITINNVNNTAVNYTVNNITANDWILMESNGCVFLPEGFDRIDTNISWSRGYYWSPNWGTIRETTYAIGLLIYYGGVVFNNYHRREGLSVRLVCEIN